MTPLTKRTPDRRRHLDQVRAVSYIRQSKRREDDSRASPEAQRAKCEALITAKGWDLARELRGRGPLRLGPERGAPGVRGNDDGCPGGHVDAVVVFALSRLTRQGAFEAMKIEEELRRHDVLLVSVEQPFLDTSTPVGVAIFGLIAALAKQESDLESGHGRAVHGAGHGRGPCRHGRRPRPGEPSGVVPVASRAEVQRGRCGGSAEVGVRAAAGGAASGRAALSVATALGAVLGRAPTPRSSF
ncbi:recombinase family protein [Streptomyces lydicus]|uniref:recombinase family protein n=1 Tax=Streptomyces lydicus TaxID=47763 RepID=UPI0037A9215E